MTCAYCGCAITAELKKGRYVYYRCKGGRDPHCPGKRVVPEDTLTIQFARLFEGLRLTDLTLAWLKDALRESLTDERELTERQLATIQTEEAQLRKQLERLYLDKISGDVPAAIYPSLKERLEQELAEAEVKATALKHTEPKYYDAGERILELAQRPRPGSISPMLRRSEHSCWNYFRTANSRTEKYRLS